MSHEDSRAQTHSELFWAAGFWDGEGCATSHLSRSKEPQKRYPQLTIGQTDREVLERFQAAIGGLGTIGGPYRKKNPNWRPMYHWRSNGKNARPIMEMLYPLVSAAKREQFNRVFSQ